MNFILLIITIFKKPVSTIPTRTQVRKIILFKMMKYQHVVMVYYIEMKKNVDKLYSLMMKIFIMNMKEVDIQKYVLEIVILLLLISSCEFVFKLI